MKRKKKNEARSRRVQHKKAPVRPEDLIVTSELAPNPEHPLFGLTEEQRQDAMERALALVLAEICRRQSANSTENDKEEA